MVSRNKGPLVVCLLVVVLFACAPGAQYREDVISCEEAAAVLVDCCPGFDASRLSCVYELDSSCGRHETTRPALDLDDSRCIREKSCDDLRPEICVRAQEAGARVTCTGDDPSNCYPLPETDRHPRVCP